MFFLTRIRIRIYSGSTSGPNTNTNIFVSIKWTEYKYSNIFGSNIQILFDEYSNIPWNAAIGIKFCIPKIPRSNLPSLLPMEIIIRGGVIIKIRNKLGKIPN